MTLSDAPQLLDDTLQYLSSLVDGGTISNKSTGKHAQATSTSSSIQTLTSSLCITKKDQTFLGLSSDCNVYKPLGVGQYFYSLSGLTVVLFLNIRPF